MALYRTLGVEHNSNFANIRKAYGRKCIVNHPDKGGDHAAMVALNEAYSILKGEYTFLLLLTYHPCDGYNIYDNCYSFYRNNI